jgi:hypothetical protein
VSNYSLQYYNGGHYPIPQTAMVVLMEAIKLLATVIRSKGLSEAKKLARFEKMRVCFSFNEKKIKVICFCNTF